MSLSDVLSRITAAEDRAGRAPGSVKLIAVSKVQPEDRVTAVLDAGHRLFGENRVQEAQGRWDGRRNSVPGLELRLIGPLQSNKAAAAVALRPAGIEPSTPVWYVRGLAADGPAISWAVVEPGTGRVLARDEPG